MIESTDRIAENVPMTASTDTDFSNKIVPPSSRRTWYYVLLVWLGFVLVVGIMAVGGGLAGQMSKDDLQLAILLGNLLLGCAAAFSGFIGAESGKTFNMLLFETFPGKSWRLVSLFVPLVMVGWYSIESALFANYVGHVTGLGEIGRHVLMFLSAVGFAVSAYFGFRAIGYVSLILVPIIFALGFFAITKVVAGHEAAFGFAETHITLLDGTATVASSWILAVLLCLPDLTRFCKTPRAGAIIGFLGIFIGNIFNFAIGAAGAALTRQYDPALILASLGFVALGLLLSFANIWTTNDNNLYSAALHVSNMANIPRKKAVALCALIGAVIAVFNPANLSFIFSTLVFMGSTGPALGGVVLGRYAMKVWFRFKKHDNAGAAWLGWIIGSTAGFISPPILAIPVGFFTAVIVWLIAILIRNSSVVDESKGDDRQVSH